MSPARDRIVELGAVKASASVEAIGGVKVVASSNVRDYKLYQAQTSYHIIHEAKIAKGHYAYNHDVSLEWFNGKFYAAWNGHRGTFEEGEAGQVNVLSVSEDFENWSEPIEYLSKDSENPIISEEGVMWQPNLLNYNGQELWCLWCLCHPANKSAVLEHSGTYFSKLSNEPNAKWENFLIIDRHEIDGMMTIGFPSQNPFKCESGRVIVPITFIYSPKDQDLDRYDKRWNACAYSDDDGRSWDISNAISQVSDAHAQWEPFFFEEADGNLRCFMRNFTFGTPAGTYWQLTTTGTGSKKGEPVVFDPDPWFSRIETVNSRAQVFRMNGGRYCMLHHDVFLQHGLGQWEWDSHRDYHSRLNVSLFFSRSGRDDFVAALPVSKRNIVSTYPQGLEHDGKIYAAYTVGGGYECRSVEGAVVDLAPADDKYYIWPREKEYVKMDFRMEEGRRVGFRVNPEERSAKVKQVEDGQRNALLFRNRASAGVEVDSPDFESSAELMLTFEFKVNEIPETGFAVLCTFGDRIPIRLAIPANRRGFLYAYSSNEWRNVGKLKDVQWHKVLARFCRDKFYVGIDGKEMKCFDNPIVSPNARLYLGDGYESNYLPSNIDAEFLIDIDSLATRVVNKE